MDDPDDTKPDGMVTEKYIVDAETNKLYDWIGGQHGELDDSSDNSVTGEGIKDKELTKTPMLDDLENDDKEIVDTSTMDCPEDAKPYDI